MIRDVVAAAILDDLSSPSRLLAARRSRPAELAGRWELPGGKVDQGETATAALVREITEELGVTIEPGGELGAGSDWMISPTWRLRVWPAVISSGTPLAGDSHDELRWLSGAELGRVDWLPPDRPAIALLAALL